MNILFRLVLLVALALPAYSQTVLYTLYGDSKGHVFGYSASGAGDVNSDGYSDLIVGAWGKNINGPYSGSASVYSGLDGSLLYAFNGDSADNYFGVSVSGAGDANGDGYADVIVGALQDDNNGLDSGSARVFSGADGSVLYTMDGDSPYSWFGSSVSDAGDVNGDGFADQIVGAVFDSKNGTSAGSARVSSGVDGSALYTFYGDAAEDFFGTAVSGAGDVNGDGYPDVIVGAPGSDINGRRSGMARVFSGLDGNVLYTFYGDSGEDTFGSSVGGAGDIDADGYGDLIVGARFDDNNGGSSGSARAFSGKDGSVLYTFDGDLQGAFFGTSVSGAGDVNGDGFADMVVGAPGPGSQDPAQPGSVRVLSGQDGSVLNTFYGDSPADDFGRSVSGAGDVNGDGYDNLIVGAPDDDDNGQKSGSARVFSGWGPIGKTYCSPAAGNSSGLSGSIQAIGIDVAAAETFYLHATGLPILQFGYFLASQTQGLAANPGGSQGTLCLGGQIARFRDQMQGSGGDGQFTIRVDLKHIPTTPPHAVFAGETWNFQAWFRDSNPSPTSNFTDAVSVTFK